VAPKDFKIRLSKLQRDALLVLLGEAENNVDMKAILPEHNLRAAAYKAIRKVRKAVATTRKD